MTSVEHDGDLLLEAQVGWVYFADPGPKLDGLWVSGAKLG